MAPINPSCSYVAPQRATRSHVDEVSLGAAGVAQRAHELVGRGGRADPFPRQAVHVVQPAARERSILVHFTDDGAQPVVALDVRPS
jgi:hypothetical protein